MSEEYKEPLTDTGLPENAFRELGAGGNALFRHHRHHHGHRLLGCRRLPGPQSGTGV